MVKIFQHSYNYEHNWDVVSLAFWLRYPNPFASHVQGCDVIDRYVDSEGVLHTRRLLLKTGKVPKWGRSILKQPDTYIIEDSIVNPKAKFMTSVTKNISHARIMKVEEVQTYHENRENPQWTSNKTEARIVSNIGWGLTRSLESFGIKNFQKNTDRSRKGMSYILEKIREQNPILNYRNHQTQSI